MLEISVMKRLLALISNSARLIADNDAIKKQAENASKIARDLMNSAAESADKSERKKSESKEAESEIMDLLRLKSEELAEIKNTLKSKLIDLEAMKRQSESLAREYDNLLNEHTKVTKKLEQYESEGLSGSDAKKSN